MAKKAKTKTKSKSKSSKTVTIKKGSVNIKKPAALKATKSKPTTTQRTGNYYSDALAEMTKNPIKEQQERALTDTSLLGGEKLAGMYGITYDRNAIEDILNNATNAAYVQEFNEQKVNEDNFYNELASTAATQYDQARQDRGAAIMSGASAGARAANELSNMLGVSQNSADALTQLSQQRKQIQDSKATALAQNAATALDKANSAGQALGTLDMTHQSNMVNQYTADSEYNAQVQQNNANMWSTAISALMGAKSTRDASALAADATKEAAALQGTGDQNAAWMTALGNVTSAKLTSDATKNSAAKSAAAQVRAARIAARGSKGYSSGGGGYSYSKGKYYSNSKSKANGKGASKKGAAKTKAITTVEKKEGKGGFTMERTKTTLYNEKTGKVVKETYGDWANTKTPWKVTQGVQKGIIKNKFLVDNKGNVLKR